MFSSFSSLETARRALQAQQQALQVVSHNIANVNTPGFSRQAVRLAAVPSGAAVDYHRDPHAARIGGGVEVAEIHRLRDVFLDYHLRREMESQGYWTTRHDALQRMEALVNEPTDHSLNMAMARFWGAWQGVANEPQDAGVRSNLIETAQSLASALRGQAYGMRDFQRFFDNEFRGKAAPEVNAFAERIAALNREIAQLEHSGGQANDLKDQRDSLITDLARLVRVTAVTMDNGAVSLFISGHALVEQDHVNQLHIADDAAGRAHLRWTDDDSEAIVESGELRGLLDARDTVIPQHLETIDQLAASLITAVNTVHTGGYDRGDRTGQIFFSGAGAFDIAVDAALLSDPTRVAAAAGSGTPGDGSLALQIAQLQDAPIAPGGAVSLAEYYQAAIVRLGSEAQQSSVMLENSQLMTLHLTQRQEATAGVSLDEAATDLIRYQRAYEAAARVVTAVDELLDKLINSTGVVGR